MRKTSFLFIIFLIVSWSLTGTAFWGNAAEPVKKKAVRKAEPPISVPQADTSARLALVIGNSAYESSPLKNPVNDASDLAAALKDLGFTVILKTNADHKAMEEALEEFGNRLKKGGVGLFYYAGHGVQVQMNNYLIPVGAKVNKESDVKYEALDAGKILDEMANANNGLNIVVLDACRDNPFGRKFRSTSRGLAGISNAPLGTFISYSTGPGNVAQDGDGRNSPYTAALLETIKKPGLTIEQVFKGVRQKISTTTGGKQIPWELSSLQGEFYFKPASRPVTGPPAPGLEEPPKKDTFNLDDLEKKAAADRTVWSTSLKNMKISFQKVEDYEKGGAASDLKIEAWQRFLGTYQDKNPYSDEDTKLREKAEGRVNHWQEEKQALAEQKAKKPAVSTAMAPRPPQAPAGSAKRITNSFGMEMVLIPAGSFTMGSPTDEPQRDSDEIQHRVTLSRPYYMQTTEVTQGQWKSVMGNNPSNFSNCGDDCPVEKVSWNDTQEFIKKLNQKESTSKYRLPTEAEWEYAARAGTTTPFYTGNCISTDQSNYGGTIPLPGCSKGEYRGKTVRVKSFDPNAFGLYDMHGNVWEWCQDWQGNYPSGSVTDPTGPSSGRYRVLRGGSWLNDAGDSRSADRFGSIPDNRSYHYGFRVARDY